jgi:hypothetical protein
VTQRSLQIPRNGALVFSFSRDLFNRLRAVVYGAKDKHNLYDVCIYVLITLLVSMLCFVLKPVAFTIDS